MAAKYGDAIGWSKTNTYDIKNFSKAQRLFVYFAESISPITVSFCPTTAK